MGWQLIWFAADTPPITEGSSDGVAVALITTLGTVFGSVIAYVIATRGSRTSNSPPTPADPALGERIAVVETHDRDDRRTLAQLDRHVDGIGDVQDRHGWRLDRLEQWVRGQGGQL